MRIILYHPRFPTNNVIPPELDVLPSSSHSPSHSQQFSPPIQSNAHPYTNRHGTTSAPSTVYRVSTTTGITTSHRYPENANSSRPNRDNPSGSQSTLHAGQKSAKQGADAPDGERARTPTQSNAYSQAKQAEERPSLDLNSGGKSYV